jgi:hypothetical protein
MVADREGFQHPATDRVRVVKVQKGLQSDIRFSRYTVPRREVRDRVVSFMRFYAVRLRGQWIFVSKLSRFSYVLETMVFRTLLDR